MRCGAPRDDNSLGINRSASFLQFLDEVNTFVFLPLDGIVVVINQDCLRPAFTGHLECGRHEFVVAVVTTESGNNIVIALRAVIGMVPATRLDGFVHHVNHFEFGVMLLLHIKKLTEILLRALRKRTNEYHITDDEINSIATASSMHDIGKITIPGEILNKPGRLTAEEFEIMKTHSMNGAKMLDGMQFFKNEPLMKFTYEICRWHHERWDGRGYPDGLKENDIPIA